MRLRTRVHHLASSRLTSGLHSLAGPPRAPVTLARTGVRIRVRLFPGLESTEERRGLGRASRVLVEQDGR